MNKEQGIKNALKTILETLAKAEAESVSSKEKESNKDSGGVSVEIHSMDSDGNLKKLGEFGTESNVSSDKESVLSDLLGKAFACIKESEEEEGGVFARPLDEFVEGLNNHFLTRSYDEYHDSLRSFLELSEKAHEMNDEHSELEGRSIKVDLEFINKQGDLFTDLTKAALAVQESLIRMQMAALYCHNLQSHEEAMDKLNKESN